MKKKSVISAAMIVLFAFCLDRLFSGHNYIAYTMYFIAALLVIFSFVGKKLKRVICALIAVGLVYFVIVEVPIISASQGDDNAQADYIIVLGAAVHGDTPSLSLYERMTAARDYLLTHPDTKAIVSGGQGGGENMSEAKAMQLWLCDNGIVPERVIMEGKATSTYENLRNSREILKSLGEYPGAKLAVVTSEYHIYRAKLIAGSLDMEVAGIAAHTTYPTVRLNYFIREAFGVTYQYIFG